MIKRSVSYKIFSICNTVFLSMLMLVTIYPVIYVVLASISAPNLFIQHEGLLLWPQGFSLSSFAIVFNDPMVLSGYGNTLFILIFGIMLNMLLTSFGAYFLSRKGIKLQKPIMLIIMFTMFFSGGLIPFYITVRDVGLYDSLWAVILPSAVSTFNMIILRTAFYEIPDCLEESALIDGANDFVILFKIIMPLAKASLAVVALYYLVGHWNAWFNAMIFIQDRAKFPLQLVLRNILIMNETNNLTGMGDMGDFEGVAQTIRYSIIVVATVPILCVYPFLQKYFVKGVMIGAVKG